MVLRAANVDTDQIIPARFLKIIDQQGLGEKLFYDWRFIDNGKPCPDFVLNQPSNRSAQILIAGDNFGCGSSREHAAWALLDYGIRVVISTSIAEIFRNNALRNGLLTIEVGLDFFQHLIQFAPREISVSLKDRAIRAGSHTCFFKTDPFARYCMLAGQDQLDFLLGLEPDIARYEERCS